MSLRIDEGYLTRTLSELVQINSCNPSLSPGAPGDIEISAYIADQMRSFGAEVNVHSLSNKHANTVGILHGNRDGKSMMWNAHMDTVGVEGMTDPFSAEIRDGRLYGRGSQDMKGSIAAMLAAAKALADLGEKLGGDLIITAIYRTIMCGSGDRNGSGGNRDVAHPVLRAAAFRGILRTGIVIAR